jgi:acetyltransferase-like isoleucine patch superfamily enzyme
VAGISVQQKFVSLFLGKSVVLDPGLSINAGCVSIGDYSYTGSGRISSLPETRIKIGKFTSIASGIQIIGASHKNHLCTYSFPRLLPEGERDILKHGVSQGDIIVGNDVWIGTNVIILSGVTIGDGAIIGAGAVVTKDIPPYAIALGVPAKVKKKRFSDDEITLLLEARWWDWKFEKIKGVMPMFYDETLSVADFLECARSVES